MPRRCIELGTRPGSWHADSPAVVVLYAHASTGDRGQHLPGVTGMERRLGEAVAGGQQQRALRAAPGAIGWVVGTRRGAYPEPADGAAPSRSGAVRTALRDLPVPCARAHAETLPSPSVCGRPRSRPVGRRVPAVRHHPGTPGGSAAGARPHNAVRVELPDPEPGGDPQTALPSPRHGRSRSGAPSGVLVKDRQASVYIHEMTWDGSRGRTPGSCPGRVRAAATGAASDPTSGVRAHERTMTGPKEDRYQLLKATGVNLSPVILLREATPGRRHGTARPAHRGRPGRGRDHR